MGNRQLKTRLDEEDYFNLLNNSDKKFEFSDGQIIAMVGGSKAHRWIETNFADAIRGQLSAGCSVYTESALIKTSSEPSYRVPDIAVVCGEEETESIKGNDVITNPIVLIEVISAKNQDEDLKIKAEEYQKIASLRDYLIVSQYLPHIICYEKRGDFWRKTIIENLEDSIEISSINVTVKLSEIYRRIKFEA